MGSQPLEEALLRFVRLERVGTLPGKLQQRLERWRAFRDTHLDLACVHGDPPDVANHRNTAQMFPGFYHRRRVPCTRKPPSRATLSLDSFHVHSSRMGGGSRCRVGLGNPYSTRDSTALPHLQTFLG